MNVKDFITWEQLWTNKKLLINIYVTIEVILFITIVIFNMTSDNLEAAAEYIKILFVITGLIFLNWFIEKQDNSMIWAITFTLIADFFLVFSIKYIYGIAAYIIVQIIFTNRILKYLKQSWSIVCSPLLKWVSIVAIFAGLIGMLKKWSLTLSVMLILIMIYVILFAHNIINMIKCYMYVADESSELFLTGLLLFLLSDINVAIYNLNVFGLNINPVISEYCGYIIWLFYLPSQICFVLSAVDNEYIRLRGKSVI